MPDQNNKFEDHTPGLIDPRIQLGILIAQVNNLQKTSDSTASQVGQIADDVLEIKLARATEIGQNKGYLNMAKVMEFTLTVGASAVAAVGAIKALANGLPPHTGP